MVSGTTASAIVRAIVDKSHVNVVAATAFIVLYLDLRSAFSLIYIYILHSYVLFSITRGLHK